MCDSNFLPSAGLSYWKIGTRQICMKWLLIIRHVNSVEQCRTVSTVLTFITRCYLHLRWYFCYKNTAGQYAKDSPSTCQSLQLTVRAIQRTNHATPKNVFGCNLQKCKCTNGSKFGQRQRHHHFQRSWGVLFWRAAVSNDGCHHLRGFAPKMETADISKWTWTLSQTGSVFLWRKMARQNWQNTRVSWIGR